MLQNNVYLISTDTTAILVDPSCRPDQIRELIGERTIDAILFTHCHFDHIGAGEDMRASTGALTYASAIDTPIIVGDVVPTMIHRHNPTCPVDVQINDGDTVQIGDITLQAILTPGHSKGSMCFFANPASASAPTTPTSAGSSHCDGVPLLIAGDTLFAGTTGRTDFEGGDDKEMFESLTRLAKLPDETLVLPGHGPLTTIGNERHAAFAMWGVR